MPCNLFRCIYRFSQSLMKAKKIDKYRIIMVFYSLFNTMKTLFWALFGSNDLSVLNIKNGDQKVTEWLGQFIYALYLLVAVIVLLNALIAMMSSTYTRVQVKGGLISISQYSIFFL